MSLSNKFSDTRSVSIKELLSNAPRLKVPRFQRNYDWDKEKAEQLWDDLLYNFNIIMKDEYQESDVQYLLGPVVLVIDKKYNRYLVIDGQQRLATLTILFCVVRDIMYEYDVKDGIEKIESLIATRRGMGKQTTWKLELNDTDKNLFKIIQEYEEGKKTQSDRFKDKKYKTKSEKLLKGNYMFLRKKVLAFLNRNFNGNSNVIHDEKVNIIRIRENIPILVYFIDCVCDYNYVVKVAVEDGDTAFQIFETLNERGQQLAKSNLIKNHILNQINETEEYGEYKQKEQSDRWNHIFDEIVGNNQRDDDFIMESYNSRLDNVNSLRTIYAEQQKEKQKEKPLPMSKRNLYKVIKTLVKTDKECETLIDELENDAKFLSTLNDISQYVDKNSRDDVYAMKILQAKFIRAPLLAAYRKWYDDRPKHYSELVEFLVKFFFKIRVVRREHPGTIDKIANDAISMINRGSTLQEIITKLKNADDHKNFMDNFRKFMRAPKKDTAKYVLQQFTIHLGTKYSDVKPMDNLTLEHILPQNHHEYWDEKEFFDGYQGNDGIDDFKNRLGNQTLLQNTVNIKNQNYKFSFKKDNKDKDGNQVGYLSSKLEINKETVCNNDVWTANIIEEREKQFTSYADQIWDLTKYPKQ